MKFVASIAALLLSVSVACAQQGASIPKVWTIQSPMIAEGCYQATGVSAATSLATVAGGAIPSSPVPATFAVVQTESASRWRDDGTAPTASVGMPLAASTPVYFSSMLLTSGTFPLSNIQLIPTTGSMTIDVCFYGVR